MIDLNTGFTVILAKRLTKYEFIKMLSNILSINKEHIKVINSYEELYDKPLVDEDKILILLRDISGKFSQLASFILSDGLKYNKSEYFVEKICAYFDTECLLPDGSSQSDIDMVLFLPSGTKKMYMSIQKLWIKMNI